MQTQWKRFLTVEDIESVARGVGKREIIKRMPRDIACPSNKMFRSTNLNKIISWRFHTAAAEIGRIARIFPLLCSAAHILSAIKVYENLDWRSSCRESANHSGNFALITRDYILRMFCTIVSESYFRKYKNYLY